MSPARVYTLLLIAGVGTLFAFFLPTVYSLHGVTLDRGVAPWYNSDTRQFNEFVMRLFGYSMLGVLLSTVSGSNAIGIIFAEVLCGFAFLLRYQYGVARGLPDSHNNAMLMWAGAAVLDIAVNMLVFVGSKRMAQLARWFDAIVITGVGLGGYFLIPFFGSSVMPPDMATWFLREGQTVVVANFQLAFAASVLLGLFSLFSSTRNPFSFAVAFALMALTEGYKYFAFQSKAISLWQSPTVPLMYFLLFGLGALLNTLEWMAGRRVPVRAAGTAKQD